MTTAGAKRGWQNDVESRRGRQERSRVWRFWTVNCFNTLRTGDADLRFYITTVQDGW